MGGDWERYFDEGVQAWFEINRATGETKWIEGNDDVGEGAAGKEEEEAAPIADEWRAVYVVRYEGGGPVFKHWALYVIDEQENSPGFLCNLEGQRTKYRYVCKKTRKHPKDSTSFVDMHQVGWVETDDLKKLRDFAKAKKIMNEDQYWGCQDWTWEIIAELEEAGLLQHGDEYEKERSELESLKGAGK
ncbi:hypothetical protein BDZ45DRAFT_803102 [Acephala macrosclerotiorum]|nr:hypothetical protein BDZ45DRAFT_803102 [Acephala macrosclerotiorum]